MNSVGVSSSTQSRSNSEMLRDRMRVTGGRLHTSYQQLWADPEVGGLVLDFLVLMHQIVRASVPLMEAARSVASRHSETDAVARELSTYLAAHIEEERHHDTWLLEDLAGVGLTPDDVLSTIPPPSVAALVGAQYYWIQHHDPVCLLGYMRLLEGSPPSTMHIERLRRQSDLPSSAFRTYRMHGELDPHHLRELDDLIDALPLTESQGFLIWTSASHTANALSEALDELRRGRPRRKAANRSRALRTSGAQGGR